MKLLTEGIIQSMPFPMWVFDNATLQFLEVNEHAINRYGYSREEFLQMNLDDIRPAPEVDRLHQHLQTKQEAKRQKPSLWRHKSKSGEVFWVKVRCQRFQHQPYTAVMIEEENSTFMKLGNLTDTEQLDFLIENSLDIFAVLDCKANFIFATKSLELCTGYPLESLIGTCAFDRILDEDLEAVSAIFQQIINEPNQVRRVSFRYLGSDQKYRHFEAIGRLVTRIPEFQGISIQARDVTERIKAEETLKIQNQKLLNIAWHQSHSVRAPLANIMGLVHLMQYENTSQAEMEEYLNMLNEAASQLDRAIHTLTNLI